jgi:hypothetical protein
MVKKNKDLKFLKDAIKDKAGTRFKVHYSDGELIGFPKGTLTIYAKGSVGRLPKELSPQNDTDLMTDYFEGDRARIKPRSKYHKQVLMALKKKEEFNKKLWAKREAKWKAQGL